MLQQYSSLVNPIASGFPVQTGSTQTQANPVTTAMGGALIGSKFGMPGALIGGGLGFLGGVTIMDKLKKIIFDIEVDMNRKTSKYIMLLLILSVLGIIF